MSLTLGCCDAAACVDHGAEAGSESSPHFALVRFHSLDEDPAEVAINLQTAGDTHGCNDHIARWAGHERGFTIPSHLRSNDVAIPDTIRLSFRPHVSLTTLTLLPITFDLSMQTLLSLERLLFDHYYATGNNVGFGGDDGD